MSEPATAPPRGSGPLPTRRQRRRYGLIVAVLAGLAVLFAWANLAWGNPMPPGSAGFWTIARLRAVNLAVMAVVAFCQGVATVAFQTAANNRIITPSIMGFESLYVLIQTGAVFFLGEAGLLAVQGLGQYVLQVGLMVGFATLLYGWLLTDRFGSLHILLLVGIVLGAGLGAVATFMRNLLTPSEFDLLSARLIGSLANADADYLPVS
ncbi:MAG: iron chelate uptake ABC transporter family permease subunit, partial [Propionibacteriaceae bacterium]|nr:iron chelate uptake ABC transporter family permease subunit [Propionibacteriaceae bacterium]